MKRHITIIPLLALLLCLTSCQSKEEKVISRLNSLSERIEEDGSKFDSEDWEEALEDLSDIHEDMEDCEFTQEQMKEVGKADGKLSAVIAKEGAKTLGHEFSNAIKNFGSFASGFKEGAEENVSEEDFKDTENEINEALKDVDKLFK